MATLIALVTGVDIGMRIFRQERSAPPDRNVMHRSGRGLWNGNNPACLCRDDFILNTVAFFLFGVLDFLLVLRALYGLFGSVEQERLRLFFGYSDLALNAHRARRAIGSILARDPTDSGPVHAVQKRQKILCDMTTVDDEHDKKVILKPAHAVETTRTVLTPFKTIPCRS